MKLEVFGWNKENVGVGASAGSLFSFNKVEFVSAFNVVFKEVEQSVNVIFVDNWEIQMLNGEFRKKDEPTDVLSFNLDEGEILGEVYVSLEFLKEQDRLNEVEVLRMIVHGILHLLGYDHDNYFEYSENSIGDSIGIANKAGASLEKMFVEQEKYLMKILQKLNK